MGQLMGQRILRLVLAGVLLGGLGLVTWKLMDRLGQDDDASGPGGAGARPPAPVEVGAVRVGTIVDRRTFSGTLEALASFVVAPKIGGRIKKLAVDVGDPVRRGATVAWLDDEELVQAEAQAAADLAVAQANLSASQSALHIADRELERIRTLNERGVTSETQLDMARAEQLSKSAAVEVAAAQVTRAEAMLAASRIRLGYTEVAAQWPSGDDERVVGERFVSEGTTVAANAPLFRIVELDPILAVINVVERDYGRLANGQHATFVTDALPGVPIEGRVVRVAPIFRETTRQARVEISIENKGQRLKPGMFVRATTALAEVANATIVPQAALTKRGDQVGIFVVVEEPLTVRWCPVAAGIREGGDVQVTAVRDPHPEAPPPPAITGRVVTLGHELVSDGAPISIPTRGGTDGDGAASAPAARGVE